MAITAGGTDCSSGLSLRIFQNLIYDSKWVANQAGYAVGARACPTTPNGFGYQVSAITTGTTSGGEPTWPLIINNTVVDGGVTWKCIETANPTGRILSVNPGYVFTTADLDAFRLLAYTQARGIVDALNTDKIDPTSQISSGNPYLLARTITGQLISNATYVGNTVKYDGVLVDTDSAYNTSTGVFTVPSGKGGEYSICASIAFSAAVAVTKALGLFKSGTQMVEGQNTNTPATGTTIPLNVVWTFGAGDTIELKAWQNSGGNQALNTVAVHNFISIKRLG